MNTPKKKARKAKVIPFDAVEYLDNEEAIAGYVTAVLELNDPDLFIAALGDVARARGMAEVARRTGLGRESLYKALSPGAKPRLDTIMRVAHALGLQFAAHTIPVPA